MVETKLRTCCIALIDGDWSETLRVDTRRHNRDWQIVATSLTSFCRGISARSNDVFGAAQHTRKNLFRSWQSTWHCYFGTVQHHHVRKLERRANDAEWNRRVKNYEVGADLFCHFVDALNHPRMRQQHRFLRSPNDVWLLRVELRRVFVWRSKYRERIGRKPAPPLPKQVLNSTDLWREIVSDEKVFHGRRSHQY